MLVMASPATAATPDTNITSGPSGPIASKTATFKFKATVSGSSFQCKIDSKNWASCDSPKKYKKLEQGGHTFQVRARKRHNVDHTPASRSFTVDTVAPETTVDTGPNDPFSLFERHYTEDQTPDFTFHSSEPGSFECRITSESSSPPFAPCESPFTPASPLPRDVFYAFEVRAIDDAGNSDSTPGSYEFDVETPMTEDQPTADLAAAIYFPDTIDMDVPSSCGGNPAIDCPGGNAAPAADQLRVTSGRALQAIANQHRYDVTVTQSVQTLSPFKMNYSGANCDVTLTSANGTSPTWSITAQLQFVISATSGRTHMVPSNVQLTGLETADYSLAGDFICTVGGAFIPASVVADQYEQWFANYWMCAAPGPDYIGPCTSESG
jgi:hypothetical protein